MSSTEPNEIQNKAQNKAIVAQIFQELAAGNHRALLSRTAEHSRWTVTGTSPVTGVYPSRKDFYERVLSQITSRLEGRVQPKVLRLLAEGEMVVVEWKGTAKAKNGAPYNNDYCWVLRIQNGEITEGTIYSDTALVSTLLGSP